MHDPISRATGSVQDRLRALKIELPSPPAPVGSFVPHVREGNLLFLSGQGPTRADGFLHQGRVGDDVTPEEAYDHARVTGLNLLAVMQEALGSLDRVRRVVKLFGMVNAVPEFGAHPQVINGCSDLFLAVFGAEKGRHARSAVGMASLPNRITVEIEAVVAVED
ncbi:hypothetical protein K32_05960 [Kaistia sp. 32K]|uniref:RidA family protein n=1 Tax=Kaistia sp. 32K TaxID=2795690 RepID=UPI0019168EE1|nr:RidA family protein [Kaistia sp. 32K]BCP51979.1 hypothetical protein K32_05960 [Kaistia sp. 32K]